MFRLLTSCFAAVTLLASLSLAHDERLHKANALTGEIVAVTADGLQLKTKDRHSHGEVFEQDQVRARQEGCG